MKRQPWILFATVVSLSPLNWSSSLPVSCRTDVMETHIQNDMNKTKNNRNSNDGNWYKVWKKPGMRFYLFTFCCSFFNPKGERRWYGRRSSSRRFWTAADSYKRIKLYDVILNFFGQWICCQQMPVLRPIISKRMTRNWIWWTASYYIQVWEKIAKNFLLHNKGLPFPIHHSASWNWLIKFSFHPVNTYQ